MGLWCATLSVPFFPSDVQVFDGSRRGGCRVVELPLVHFLAIGVDSSTDETLRGFSCFLQAGPAKCHMEVWLCVLLYNPSQNFVSVYEFLEHIPTLIRVYWFVCLMLVGTTIAPSCASQSLVIRARPEFHVLASAGSLGGERRRAETTSRIALHARSLESASVTACLITCDHRQLTGSPLAYM